MKVKAVEVNESCRYVTEGCVYNCHEHELSKNLVVMVDDEGEELIGLVSSEKDAHGVKWEIVE